MRIHSYDAMSAIKHTHAQASVFVCVIVENSGSSSERTNINKILLLPFWFACVHFIPIKNCAFISNLLSWSRWKWLNSWSAHCAVFFPLNKAKSIENHHAIANIAWSALRCVSDQFGLYNGNTFNTFNLYGNLYEEHFCQNFSDTCCFSEVISLSNNNHD